MNTQSTNRQQYIVQFPSTLSANQNWPQTISQNKDEVDVSRAARKVATLAAEQVDELRKLPGVKVYLNRPISIPKGEVPHPVKKMDASLTVGVPSHGADKLQAMGINGQGVYVAVVDTGIFPHEDLNGGQDIKKFFDATINEETAPTDDHGHGTHCSGIVGASGGITGMAPEVSLIGVKVLNAQGYGSDATVMAGIDKAIEYFNAGFKPMVISMSLGDVARPVAEDPLVAKIKEAADLGIFVSIAAGNEGPGAGTIGSPGTTNHPRVLTVAAFDTRRTQTQDDDRIASFSSVGDNSQPEMGQDAMDIGADGVNVRSLAPDNRYVSMSGTSMATPFVSGALALLMSGAMQLAAAGKLKVSPEEINYAELLASTANDHPKISDVKEGRGELCVDKAYEKLVLEYGIIE